MTDGVRDTKRRLTTILIALPLLAGGLVFFTITQHQQGAIETEQSRFGHSSARQLAAQVAGYVVERDILPLNVLVTHLTRDEPLQFAAIYDESNRLIAQSGKEQRNNSSYTAEVTFQDSLIGRVRITVSPTKTDSRLPALLLILLGAGYSLLIRRFSPLIHSWIDQEPTPVPVDNQVNFSQDTGPTEECILVVRIRPARHLEQHFDKFFQAANLYGGIVEQTTPEELVIHFDSADAMYMATCSGLLIQKIANKVNGKIIFGGTLDLLDEEPDEIRKAASYLASIAEGNLLVAGGDSHLSGRVELQSFHHALVDSKRLLRIAGLTDPELLNLQARELTGKNQQAIQ